MKATKLLLLLLLCSYFGSFGQKTGDVRAWNNITFYFVDNSDGFEADALNDDMVQELKQNLNKLGSRNDNYFFFYGCNGEEQLVSDNLLNFVDMPSFKKYLRNPSKESEFSYDKQSIREHFTEYPIKAKQNVEINVYLSTYAVKRIVKEIDQLPSAIVLLNEFPLYLNANNMSELTIKLNLFINKEAKSIAGMDEEKLRSYFTFCADDLKIARPHTEINFL